MKRAYATTRSGQIHLRLFSPGEGGHPALREGGTPSIPEPAPASARSHREEGHPALHEPPLVCLHPFPYSGAFFETIAPLLSAGRLVCAPDCPGFGGSDPPPQKLSMQEIATAMHEALAACYDRLAVPFDLLGFHSGCLLAVEMARLEPARISKLALIDVPYFTPEEQAGRYPRSTADVRYTKDLNSLAAAWEFAVAKRLDGMPLNRAFGNFVEMLRAGERANWGYHATLTYDCAPRFRAVQHETLVVATQYMLKEHTRKAAALIPGSTFVERKDVTRAVMEEGAPAIAEEVLAFLEACN